MDFLDFLSRLRGDPACDPRWAPGALYLGLCVGLPFCFGVAVGLWPKGIERVFRVEVGNG